MSRTARVLASAATAAAVAGTGVMTADAATPAAHPGHHPGHAHHGKKHHEYRGRHRAAHHPKTVRHDYAGALRTWFQHRDGSVQVSGWVFDRDHRAAQVRACLFVNGHCSRRVRGNQHSPWYSSHHHLRGGHKFVVTLRPLRPGARITLRSMPTHHWLSAHRALTPGQRAIDVAKPLVGGRYTWGGTSPSTGFDCSGYARYAYQHGHVADLPHNSEAQRHAPGMHQISRSQALPGDLVFYLSGGSAYHVAIYGGHDMQYSATDPAEGIEYDRITAGNIVFATDWHR